MDKEGHFRQLLNDYQDQSQRTRYLRNKAEALATDSSQSEDDYFTSGRRRRRKVKLNEQLKQINGGLRRGQCLVDLDEDLMEAAEAGRAQSVQDSYLAQKRYLHQSRKALALAAGLSARYFDSYWVDIEVYFTHFYFGGTNGSDGDDGHGHYIVENANGLSVYQRTPFSEHGVQNVVRWLNL